MMILLAPITNRNKLVEGLVCNVSIINHPATPVYPSLPLIPLFTLEPATRSNETQILALALAPPGAVSKSFPNKLSKA